MATRGFESKILISIQSPNQSALSVAPFCLLRRDTCHEVVGVIGGLGPRLVCDGEFSGAGVSGPVLACFVSDEGFVGLEWSAPNVSHEKGSPINQVSVVLLHSSKLLRRIARRNLRVGGQSAEGGRLASPRSWHLARAAPAQVPREHSSGACPSNQSQHSQHVQSTC